jgi:hypothetical protein
MAMLVLLSIDGAVAHQKTWIVIGDSIMSWAADGEAKDLALHIVATERNVLIKNISSPGASLGRETSFGFNNTNTIATLDEICGFFSYCDGILVQAGFNDYRQSVDLQQTEASLLRILAYARSHGKKVIVTDIIWSIIENEPNDLGYTVTKYREVRTASCTVYSDICTYAPRTETSLGSPSTTLYDAAEVASGKQVHPNVAGHRAFADWLETIAAKAGLF